MSIKTVTITNPVDHNEKICLEAHYEDCRDGFNHRGRVVGEGIEAKIHYINRTWELYEFQSILHDLCEKWLAARLNLKRSRKRDAASFNLFLELMTREVDANQTWEHIPN